MKHGLSILFIGLVLLAACQSGITDSFNAEEKATDWIGENPVVLINAWGMPTQVINEDGRQYLIYMSADNISFGDEVGEVGTGPLKMINGYPQATPVGKLFCQTTFVVENGEIINALWQGDGCGVSGSDS